MATVRTMAATARMGYPRTTTVFLLALMTVAGLSIVVADIEGAIVAPMKTTLNCRRGPSTSFSIVREIPGQTKININCKVIGEDISGDNFWLFTTFADCFVSDFFVDCGGIICPVDNCAF